MSSGGDSERKVTLYTRAYPRSQEIQNDIITHKLRLFLHFKGVKCDIVPVDPIRKDEILTEKFSTAKLPFITSSHWYSDDQLDILQHIHDFYAEPNMKCTKNQENAGKDMFTQMMNWVKCTDPSKKKALWERVEAGISDIETLLQQSGGPYIAGQSPTIGDCVAYPKLVECVEYIKISKQPYPFENYPRVSDYYKMMNADKDIKKYHPKPSDIRSRWSK